jgi:hypothetical protein
MTVDLDLTVHRSGQGYQADLRVHIAGSIAPVAPLPAPATVVFDLAYLRALSLDPRAYGTRLTSMLFAAAELRAAFAQARAVAAQHSASLRLRLGIALDAEELHALRWETLADPEAPDQPLAASSQLLLSRMLPSPDWQSMPVRTGGALRAVVLIAAPADLPDYDLTALDTARESTQVHAQLGSCALTVLGEGSRASLPNLLQHLHRGTDLLFVLAHGRIDEGGRTWLYLEDEAGHTAPLASAELVARIAALDNKPRLVILGSCESAGDGNRPALVALGPQLVRAGVPAVLAMQSRITLETLEGFLPTCLQALTQDGRIDRAVAIARDLIRDRPDWWVPALWMRTIDGRLWVDSVRPAAPPNAALHQLRPPIADFVGRQIEIVRLTEMLRRAQTEEGHAAAICGVRGMGGIGKTTLAEVVAHHLRPIFPDAQLVIDLRGASAEPLTPVQALQQLVRAFVPEEKLSENQPALQARYRSLLNGRRVLILADDARNAAQVRPLLPPVGCALLITSRQRFALDGMAVLDLARLSDAEAIQLLQSICPRLTNDQAKHLTHLCGGLPLALRVSAGILLNDEGLPVKRYLKQLADERRRLAQLCDPDDPERNVAATLGLSYHALDPSIQTAFRRLGVLAADADLTLIAAVLEQTEEQSEAILRLLLRHSLVEYDTTRERWGLHDLVRVFALDLLVITGEEDVVRLRYAEQVIQVMRQINDCYRDKKETLTGLMRFYLEQTHLDTIRLWLWKQQPSNKINALIVE